MKKDKKPVPPVEYDNIILGFTYGPLKLTRSHRDDTGSVCLYLETKKYKDPLQVYVLRGGKIRIFSNGDEWFPKEKKR